MEFVVLHSSEKYLFFPIWHSLLNLLFAPLLEHEETVLIFDLTFVSKKVVVLLRLKIVLFPDVSGLSTPDPMCSETDLL